MRRTGHTVTRRGHEHGLAKLIEEGPYFTDGIRLFRIAGVVSGSSGPKFVHLEDCRTLDSCDYTEEEVTVLDLTPVSARPAGEGDGGQGSVPSARHDQHGRRARAHES